MFSKQLLDEHEHPSLVTECIHNMDTTANMKHPQKEDVPPGKKISMVTLVGSTVQKSLNMSSYGFYLKTFQINFL